MTCIERGTALLRESGSGPAAKLVRRLQLGSFATALEFEQAGPGFRSALVHRSIFHDLLQGGIAQSQHRDGPHQFIAEAEAQS